MTTPQPGRNVLFIAHTFPPAGEFPSYRAAAFARYLPRNGWRPILLTPDLAWAASRDERLLADLPSDLTVIRTPSLGEAPRPTPNRRRHHHQHRTTPGQARPLEKTQKPGRPPPALP